MVITVGSNPPLRMFIEELNAVLRRNVVLLYEGIARCPIPVFSGVLNHCAKGLTISGLESRRFQVVLYTKAFEINRVLKLESMVVHVVDFMDTH